MQTIISPISSNLFFTKDEKKEIEKKLENGEFFHPSYLESGKPTDWLKDSPFRDLIIRLYFLGHGITRNKAHTNVGEPIHIVNKLNARKNLRILNYKPLKLVECEDWESHRKHTSEVFRTQPAHVTLCDYEGFIVYEIGIKYERVNAPRSDNNYKYTSDNIDEWVKSSYVLFDHDAKRNPNGYLTDIDRGGSSNPLNYLDKLLYVPKCYLLMSVDNPKEKYGDHGYAFFSCSASSLIQTIKKFPPMRLTVARNSRDFYEGGYANACWTNAFRKENISSWSNNCGGNVPEGFISESVKEHFNNVFNRFYQSKLKEYEIEFKENLTKLSNDTIHTLLNRSIGCTSTSRKFLNDKQEKEANEQLRRFDSLDMRYEAMRNSLEEDFKNPFTVIFIDTSRTLLIGKVKAIFKKVNLRENLIEDHHSYIIPEVFFHVTQEFKRYQNLDLFPEARGTFAMFKYATENQNKSNEFSLHVDGVPLFKKIFGFWNSDLDFGVERIRDKSFNRDISSDYSSDYQQLILIK